MNFRDQIRTIATGKQKMLEIGPSYNPIIPKRDGYNTFVIDHISRDELVKKYAAYGVNVSSIEDVDFISTSIKQLPESEKNFDLIVASHVIEHTTDFIEFINSCADRLSNDGQLALIVPDKRFCFDFFRPLTSPGEVLNASISKQTRHLGGLFDHYAYFCNANGQIAWPHLMSLGDLSLTHTIIQTKDAYTEGCLSTNYIDAHEWVFTPNSFRHLVNELRMTNFLHLGIHSIDIKEFEFLVIMSKEAPPEKMERIDLLRLIYLEQLARPKKSSHSLAGKVLNRLKQILANLKRSIFRKPSGLT
jgi:2-polyprenyl-3-methyl-5-hydroxy-6-metoxy-1,4-benzoquinol methylase